MAKTCPRCNYVLEGVHYELSERLKWVLGEMESGRVNMRELRGLVDMITALPDTKASDVFITLDNNDLVVFYWHSIPIYVLGDTVLICDRKEVQTKHYSVTDTAAISQALLRLKEQK
jgi:hypothetical protein